MARGDNGKSAGPDPQAAPRFAVVVKGWPRLSETFIAQELALLEEAGHRFEIWSLRKPTDRKTHPLHARVSAPVRYLQEYLHDAPLRTLRGALWALGHRRGWALLWLWLGDFRRDLTLNRIRRLGQAMSLARELPQDIAGLYVHFLHTPASVARYAAFLRRLPWGFSAHAKDIWTSPDWELAEKIESAAFGATCTAYGAAQLRSLAPAGEEDRVSLIYHGLELDRFPAPPVRDLASANAAGADRKFDILSVGRLVEKKGFDRLIEALALIPGEIDWRWTHIGGGDLKAELAEQARGLGLAERIVWRGAEDQTEVVAAMRASDLFVLPSRVARDGDRDGLPNVLMEAATQKLPIISTAVAAIPEFIRDGFEGVLSADAPEALASAISALAQDPQRRLNLAEAAYKRLVEEFLAEPGVGRLSTLIRENIARSAQEQVGG